MLVEVESAEKCGGWVVDQQFMDLMGSPYLLAHGLGEPVPDAVSRCQFSDGRRLSRLGANARLGGAVESAGRAWPVSASDQRTTARGDVRHRRCQVALAGWRHDSSRPSDESRASRSHRLRGPLRRDPVLSRHEIHSARRRSGARSACGQSCSTGRESRTMAATTIW